VLINRSMRGMAAHEAVGSVTDETVRAHIEEQDKKDIGAIFKVEDE
jgi:hypothetical protein